MPELPNADTPTSLLVSSWLGPRTTYVYPLYSELDSELAAFGSTFELEFRITDPEIIPDGPRAFKTLHELVDLGRLAPGEYLVNAEIHDQTTIVRRGSVSFTVIPEPSSFMLVATAALSSLLGSRYAAAKSAR